MRRIDLHTHSYYSDGTSSPAEVVRRAAAGKVELLSLADHDTTSGLEEARGEAQKRGIRFVNGVEINTSDQVHILGYGMDESHPVLKRSLEDFRQRRLSRVKEIIQKLQASGLKVDWKDVEQVSRESLGRPHVADALVHRGIVHNRQEAFVRYLVQGRAGYVAPKGPSPREAIQMIREVGGWAVLAHPGVIQGGMNLEEWMGYGLEGLEVFYLSHSRSLRQELLEKAERFSMLSTGGSDYHGPRTGHEEIGGIEVPQEVYQRLLERVGG